MEKEKCLVPSVISLHVRAIDQTDKESLKNILNFPENPNNRKFSYNLVRIYNTSYPNNRSKPVNDNLPPYLSNVNSKAHILSTALINSRFNALIKKSNTEYSPLYSTCRLTNSNHYWSNAFKNNQNSVSPVFRNITSPASESEFSKSPNLLCNSTLLNSNKDQPETTTPNSSNLPKKKVSITVKVDATLDNSQTPQCPNVKKQKPVEMINRTPPIVIANQPPLAQLEVTTYKAQLKKSQLSTEKSTPKRSTSSFLIPIKERPSTSGFDSANASPSRSQTVIAKSSTFNQKPVPSASLLGYSESKKFQQTNNNEVSQKNSQPCLFSRLANNSHSIFISNNQPFLYPDPCDNENSLSFMARLSELTAYVSETVRWEKSRNSRRRCRPQTEII